MKKCALILNDEDVLTQRHSQVHFEVLAKQQSYCFVTNKANKAN